MAVRTVLTTEVPEATTPLLHATFTDEGGNTITVLNSVTLTLYDEATETIINSWLDSDVSGSVTAGVLSLRLGAADTAILNADRARERHIALFEFTWGVGLVGKHEVAFAVVNLDKVA